MKISLIFSLWMLVACSSGIEQQSKVVEKKGPPIVIQNLNGLWLDSRGEYESSFVFISNDTVYLLKGPAEKYYIHHDTLLLCGGGKFKRKIVELDSAHLIWKSVTGESSTLYKKN